MQEKQQLTPAEEKRITREKVEKYLGMYGRRFCDAEPKIRYQKMKTRWGSCRPTVPGMTFNTFLAYTPDSCVEYVVVHELAHFRQLNHSKAFYDEVAAVLPDYKERRKELRKYEVLIRDAYSSSRNNVRRRKRISVRQLYSRRTKRRQS